MAIALPSRHTPAVLTRFGFALWLLMLPAGVALLVDHRLVDAVPNWVKPLKFLASLGLFAITTAWALAQTSALAQRSRSARTVAVLIVAMSLGELAYIGLQAARGQASHFNTAEPFHALMYSLMGAGAVVLTATSGAVAWLVARHPAPGLAPLLQQSLVLGFALTVVLGLFTGAAMSAQPGHFVAHPPGGGTLPLVGWSISGGDYRVAHFLGLHTQQLLPLVGWWLVRRQTPLARGRIVLGAVAIAWCALVAIAYAQAVAGLPFHRL